MPNFADNTEGGLRFCVAGRRGGVKILTEYEEAEEGENGVRLYDIWKIGFLTVIRKSNFRIERSTKTRA